MWFHFMDFSSLLLHILHRAFRKALDEFSKNFIENIQFISFSFNDSLLDRLKQGGVFSCMKLTICHGSWHTFLQFYRLLLLIGKLPVKVKAQREGEKLDSINLRTIRSRALLVHHVRRARWIATKNPQSKWQVRFKQKKFEFFSLSVYRIIKTWQNSMTEAENKKSLPSKLHSPLVMKSDKSPPSSEFSTKSSYVWSLSISWVKII